MDDRIRLAEVMGWTGIREESDAAFRDIGLWGFPPDSKHKRGVPDPFTDANDDYAVLEWMRGDNAPTLEFGIELRNALREPGHYQIGDYARAALKVIQNG